MDVDVAVQAANLTLADARRHRHAGHRARPTTGSRSRFPVSAEDVGTARLRVVAVSGDLADAAEIELPVYTPATAEAFATYGVIDDSGADDRPAASSPRPA